MSLAVLVLILASFIAGAQNALAGGGSFLTFPALLYAGLDPRAANITSAIALFPGQLTTGFAGRSMLSSAAGLSIRTLIILSLVGGGATSGSDAANAVRAEKLPREVAEAMAKEIERKMREAAANLEFEKAAALRDELVNLRKQIGGNESVLFQGKAPKIFQHALRELIGT